MASKYGKPTKNKNTKAPSTPKYNMKMNYMKEADKVRGINTGKSPVTRKTQTVSPFQRRRREGETGFRNRPVRKVLFCPPPL